MVVSLQVRSGKRAIRLTRRNKNEDKILQEQKRREEEERRRKKEEEIEAEMRKKDEVAAALAAAKDKVSRTGIQMELVPVSALGLWCCWISL